MSDKMGGITVQKTTTVPASIGRIAIATAALAICANVQVPLQPVPFTLQILALGLIVATLNTKEALSSTLAYLVIGALGAPVFAGAMGGLTRLVGPTGGFILGFVPAAGVGSWLHARLARTRLPQAASTFFAIIAAIAIAYLFGWAQLMVVRQLSPAAAFAAGIAPFAVMDLLKAVIATSVVSAGRIALRARK